MTISWIHSCLSILGPRSRSQWLFLGKKHCHRSSPFMYRPILILFHTHDINKYDNILDKFEFERSRAKVRVTVAILENHCHRFSALTYYPISI